MLSLGATSSNANTTRNVTTTYVTDGMSDVVNGTLMEFQPFTDYVEYQVARWVLFVYRPICASIGIIGNLMCIVVVMTTSLHHSPTVVYMVTLAFLDWCVSVLGVVNLLNKDAYFGEGLFFRETWHCKTFYFFMLFIIHFDTLTMVFMTAQRYVAVGFPLHASRWVTKPMAAASLVIAAVISALANVIHPITLQIQPFDGSYRGRCSNGMGLGKFIQIWVYPWIDFVLYFLLPSVCISIFNVLIFRTLKKAEHFKQNAVLNRKSVPMDTVYSVQVAQTGVHQQGDSCSGVRGSVKNEENSLSLMHKAVPDRMRHSKTDHSQHKTSRSSGHSTVSVDNTSNQSTNTRSNSGHYSATGGNNSAMLTRMLMMVSLAYLVLTFPIGVFVVISRIWNPPGGYDKARFTLARDITESLMYTNHSINFLLYCLSGRRFRHKAAKVLFRWCPLYVSSQQSGSHCVSSVSGNTALTS